MEAKLQSKIIKWLKSKGAYVIKTTPGPGIPVGCLDVFFFYEGAYGVIEVKAAVNSPWRPGQERTLEKFDVWTPFAYKAYPDIWPQIQQDLELRFF